MHPHDVSRQCVGFPCAVGVREFCSRSVGVNPNNNAEGLALVLIYICGHDGIIAGNLVFDATRPMPELLTLLYL